MERSITVKRIFTIIAVLAAALAVAGPAAASSGFPSFSFKTPSYSSYSFKTPSYSYSWKPSYRLGTGGSFSSRSLHSSWYSAPSYHPYSSAAIRRYTYQTMPIPGIRRWNNGLSSGWYRKYR